MDRKERRELGCVISLEERALLLRELIVKEEARQRLSVSALLILDANVLYLFWKKQ